MRDNFLRLKRARVVSFLGLVAKVREINPDAANELMAMFNARTEMMKPETTAFMSKFFPTAMEDVVVFNMSHTILFTHPWQKHRFGYGYWNDIYRQINEIEIENEIVF